MSTIVTQDEFRQRREIRNLEEAVKRANLERNNVVMIGAKAPYDRSDYFCARAQNEQKLRHIPIDATPPLPRPLWKDLAAGLFFALFLAFIAVWS